MCALYVFVYDDLMTQQYTVCVCLAITICDLCIYAATFMVSYIYGILFPSFILSTVYCGESIRH